MWRKWLTRTKRPLFVPPSVFTDCCPPVGRPRLGPLLHRVMAVGFLFFMFASIEGCTRALRPKNDFSGGTLGTSVVLALLDSGICWWVFSALLSTTRTLRLRR